VPVSGPLDRVGFELANALVGNEADAPALEILIQGPAFEVAAEAVRIALVGGNGGVEVSGDEKRVVPAGRSIRLERGATFRVTPLGDVICAYLAVEGGIAVPPCLGSASTYARGGFGGAGGRPLAAGDVLAGGVATAEERQEVGWAAPPEPGLDQPIRVVLGPQQDYFSDDAVATFLSTPYRISQQADRMGFRLEGPQLAHARGSDIVSDPSVTGSIQVPGSGQPIVLMADAQTTGGYPKIATVISADVPVLGRRKPGQEVRFAAVTQREAERLRRDQETFLRDCVSGFRPLAPERVLNLVALYEQNLIGGMVDALTPPTPEGPEHAATL
jgi:allophanate hydrolase